MYDLRQHLINPLRTDELLPREVALILTEALRDDEDIPGRAPSNMAFLIAERLSLEPTRRRRLDDGILLALSWEAEGEHPGLDQDYTTRLLFLGRKCGLLEEEADGIRGTWIGAVLDILAAAISRGDSEIGQIAIDYLTDAGVALEEQVITTAWETFGETTALSVFGALLATSPADAVLWLANELPLEYANSIVNEYFRREAFGDDISHFLGDHTLNGIALGIEQLPERQALDIVEAFEAASSHELRFDPVGSGHTAAVQYGSIPDLSFGEADTGLATAEQLMTQPSSDRSSAVEEEAARKLRGLAPNSLVNEVSRLASLSAQDLQSFYTAA